MSRKPKVIIFIDWFYPAHKAGGPIRSVYNLVLALQNEIDFYIVTSAYDIGETRPLEGIQTGVWIRNENYSIIYLEKEAQTRKIYKSLIKEIEPQSIYLNSLFSVGFTLKPLLSIAHKIRTVLAPRGMLKKDALAIKAFKKKVFLFLMRSTGLMRSVVWHTSSSIEAKEVYFHFGAKSNVIVAQNLAVMMPQRPNSSISKASGKLKLIFVSRINEIKNLDFLLNVLSKIENSAISLDIYGPIEDAFYWEKCLKFIKSKNLNVEYKGVLEQLKKEVVLWKYDYLVLPTKGENFGHVIAEALCASLPVIISQNTPWRNLEKENVGFDLPLRVNSFVAVIEELLLEDNVKYAESLSSCFNYSKRNIVNSSVIEQNKQLFL